ncbi:substrate-binding periplasmic protein [Maridesulfovibrio sp. FT414]|uniref:substrate-binding periplasmic protein n=1 Tax=Maridesulfovibrio sp. FT414 TaxID=2979469 RepID=UPI003D8021D7
MSLAYLTRLFACAFIVLLFTCTDLHADRVVYLSSIDWPPYTGSSLEGEGESAKLVREAFAEMGYELKIIFVPWKRAMRLAETSRNVAGYFPEYYSAERAEKFIFSKPFSCSPVGLLMRRATPLKWETISDLAGRRLGFVAGYVNTRELDQAIGNGTIDADYAPHDESNILKVSAGRVDGAVVDPLVFNYLAETRPAVGAMKDQLAVHPVYFGVNELYVAFKHSPEGKRYCQIFNEGLKKLRARDVTVPCKK